MLEQVTNIVSNVPVEVWALLGSAFGISGVQMAAVKKLQKRSIQLTDRTNLLVTIALSCAAAALGQFNDLVSQNPAAFGAATASILAVTQPAYRFTIKPFTAWFSGLLADARAYREQLKQREAELTEANSIV